VTKSRPKTAAERQRQWQLERLIAQTGQMAKTIHALADRLSRLRRGEIRLIDPPGNSSQT